MVLLKENRKDGGKPSAVWTSLPGMVCSRVDEIAESFAAIEFRTTTPRRRTAEQAELHRVDGHRVLPFCYVWVEADMHVGMGPFSHGPEHSAFRSAGVDGAGGQG